MSLSGASVNITELIRENEQHRKYFYKTIEPGFSHRIYEGRIDIEKKSLRKQENIPQAIQQKIRQSPEDKGAQIRSERLLSKIPPQFYDAVIFDSYGDRPKPPVRSTAKLPGYKDPRPTAFLSNLKEVQLQAEDVSDLCFYPPHPAERYATIGVVTYKNQMVITVQKFRKDGCNE